MNVDQVRSELATTPLESLLDLYGFEVSWHHDEEAAKVRAELTRRFSDVIPRPEGMPDRVWESLQCMAEAGPNGWRFHFDEEGTLVNIVAAHERAAERDAYAELRLSAIKDAYKDIVAALAFIPSGHPEFARLSRAAATLYDAYDAQNSDKLKTPHSA